MSQAIMQPKDAVRNVEKMYPAGTKIRHRVTQVQYVVGAKSGLSKFAIARFGDPATIINEHATRLMMAYEKVTL